MREKIFTLIWQESNRHFLSEKMCNNTRHPDNTNNNTTGDELLTWKCLVCIYGRVNYALKHIQTERARRNEKEKKNPASN